MYVAGSDQIWNPYIFQDKQFDPSFLLGFVREGRRIAYAPSLGVPELPEDKAEELRRFLTPFSAPVSYTHLVWRTRPRASAMVRRPALRPSGRKPAACPWKKPGYSPAPL